jgi:hypothetical protein
MAINPNTDFTAGQVLTADQQNRFPRGIMALDTKTADETFTVEEVTSTVTFTAVANRNYKITYFEPGIYSNVSPQAEVTSRIRQTNLTGTILGVSLSAGPNTFAQSNTLSIVKTFTAGSVTVVATLRIASGSAVASRTATQPSMFLVEEIGPA